MQIIPARSKRIITAAAIALLGLMIVLMSASAWNDTITYDEAAHIGAGYAYLQKSDYRMNPEHPPLMKDLGGFPLLLMKLHVDWNHKSWTENDFGEREFGQMLIFNSGKDGDTITRAAKAPMIVFTIALGWVIFGWTKKQFGSAAALLALFLFTFSPTFLAHGRLVTTDVGAAAGFFVGTTAFLRFLKIPTRWNVVLAGLAMGFAFLTKFSTFALVPITGILAVAWALVHEEPGNRARGLLRTLKLTGGIFFVAYLAIYPVYLHHTWNYPPQRQRTDAESNLMGHGVGHTPKDIVIWASDKPVLRPWAEYFSGLFQAIQRSTEGNNPFFWGKVYAHGLRIYFPFVYLVKEPLALHALTIIALVFALSRVRRPLYQREWLEKHFTEFAFIVVIAFYWWLSIRSNLNIGVRHVLPTFPFIYILVANEVAVLYRWLLGRPAAGQLCPQSKAGDPRPVMRPAATWVFRLVIGTLLAWQAATVLRVYPSYLAYFNEITGGPDGGWRYVNDSNLDWGQDLKRLSQFVEERSIPEIHFDYFGAADPAYYLKEQYQGPVGCSQPPNGWVAVSAMIYTGPPWAPECDYRRWLPMEQVVAKIGYSIYVFDLPQSGAIDEELPNVKTQAFVFTMEQLLGVDPRGRIVAWSARSAQGVTNAHVYVQMDSNPKQLFAQGLEGKQEAPWISESHRFVFELFGWDGIDGPLLARITIDEQGRVARQTFVDGDNPRPSEGATSYSGK